MQLRSRQWPEKRKRAVAVAVAGVLAAVLVSSLAAQEGVVEKRSQRRAEHGGVGRAQCAARSKAPAGDARASHPCTLHAGDSIRKPWSLRHSKEVEEPFLTKYPISQPTFLWLPCCQSVFFKSNTARSNSSTDRFKIGILTI